MANLKRNLWLLPVVAGCYSYTPITPAAAPTGSEVRARITGAASDRVGPLLHSFDTRVLIGNVVENNAGAMVLQVPLGAMSNVAETIVPLQTRVPLTAADCSNSAMADSFSHPLSAAAPRVILRREAPKGSLSPLGSFAV
jgi:hypothetical protein